MTPNRQVSSDRVIAVHELAHGIALLCYDNLSGISMHAAENRAKGFNPAQARPKDFDNSGPEERYVVAMSGPKAGLRIASLEGLTPSNDDELAGDHKIARKSLEDLGFESANLEHFSLDKKIETILDTYWDVILELSPNLIENLNLSPAEILELINSKGLPDPKNWNPDRIN